ncbi:HPr family phosphocarrier protein [Paenibacillus humicola]|uniref:HPr family phosphocarrier protein n=1 Tax=Paenibacillus humicola TaxID=3110540 RepID=UPI00237BFAA1|nr:HPr family phosphocarrier protein [Paenibacillus humicola]
MRVHTFTIQTELQREDLLAISNQSARFISDLKLEFTNNDTLHTVDVKSLIGMLLVPISSGTEVRLSAQGKDEEEALEYVLGLFEKHVVS